MCTKQTHIKSRTNRLQTEEQPSLPAQDAQSVNWLPDRLSRKDLLCNLGRDHLILKSQDVQVRIDWHIRFNWTGEAESVLKAETKLPAAWREMDDRHSFDKIPSTFDQLVKQRG